MGGEETLADWTDGLFMPLRLARNCIVLACGAGVSHTLALSTLRRAQGFAFSFGVVCRTQDLMHAEDMLHHHAVPLGSLFDTFTVELCLQPASRISIPLKAGREEPWTSKLPPSTSSVLEL